MAKDLNKSGSETHFHYKGDKQVVNKRQNENF